MLKKVVIVYDAAATNFATIKREVIEPARRLTGLLVGKFVWQPVGFDENARRLKTFLQDGDLVVVAGGDGLASMAANAVLRSQREVTLAVLGYGLTNDISGITRLKRPVLYGDEYVGGIEEIIRRAEEGRTLEVFPLKIEVDGRLWRYALAHIDVGMLAASLASLDEVKKGKLGTMRRKLFGWWWLHRRETWLPEATLGEDVAKPAEDLAEEYVPDEPEPREPSTTKTATQIVLDLVSEPEPAVSSTPSVASVALAVESKSELKPEESPTETNLETADEESDYEMMITGELHGAQLRRARGGAGMLERLRALGGRLGRPHPRPMACAAAPVAPQSIEVGRLLSSRVTDILAVNSLSVGKSWRGGRFYKKPAVFRLGVLQQGSVFGKLKLAAVSRIWHIPGRKTQGKVEIAFLQPSEVFVQTDNAWRKLTEVSKIELSKADRSIRLVK